MRAARMHGYKQPLVLEDVKVPDIAADEVLVRVKAAGMCRTDWQLLDGYFKDYHSPTFPTGRRRITNPAIGRESCPFTTY